ncbi:hypothetical protein PIB30_057314 [Stylosanthes scabra]|uniref:DUS-like FMN-binding domain-containing protein n=1 Tax=Stylosanthes scabra TaxID=79078 RepID=A0ABU6QKA5_9FABA|nr:hypothetical protein [Stylosanthes scabra]
MMKFAGYSLAVSFSPIGSNVFATSFRFPVVGCIYRGNLESSRLFSASCWREQLNGKNGVVAKQYLPPWFSVAPMMDWTDNHYRTLARLISKHAWLYTEMIAAETIVHQEDNLFVAEAMSAIAANTNVPVSVKCRIGVDDHDSYDELCDFIYNVSSFSATKHFIIHSRKALLNGISPAENRSIPPLKYEYFYGLLRDFPDLKFTINGGIASIVEVNAAREAGAHGVMIGRAAYNNPWHILGHVDTAIYGVPSSGLTRRQVLKKYQVYGDSVLGKYGHRPTVRDIVKPLLNLFHSAPGNGLWKRKADAAFRSCTTIESFFEETLVAIPDSVLDSPAAEEPPPGRGDLFANIDSLLPPPYKTREEEIVLCA